MHCVAPLSLSDVLPASGDGPVVTIVAALAHIFSSLATVFSSLACVLVTLTRLLASGRRSRSSSRLCEGLCWNGHDCDQRADQPDRKTDPHEFTYSTSFESAAEPVHAQKTAAAIEVVDAGFVNIVAKVARVEAVADQP
jgi:hypothetical protein